MGLYLNRARDTFQFPLKNEIYVDKSGLIAYTNRAIDSDRRFMCVSRPRRFGKSLAAEMLEAYYSRVCDSKDVFCKLEIGKDASFETHLNQYDVIFLEMQRLLSRAGDAMELVPFIQQKVIRELRKEYPDFIDEDETSLSAALESVYYENKQGFIFIIDEWDCLFREKQSDITAQRAYLDFLRELLKGQYYVRLAYMTGILPIKKYGTHSALNMFDEFSMTTPGKMAGYIGFIEKEVKHLCEKYHMDFAETQRWYDGYKLDSLAHVYNPKSVVDAMVNQNFRSYWTATETYEALKVYIEMNFDDLKDAVILMLSGGRCKIVPRSFQNDMTTFIRKDDVLTLLVHLGYLAYDAATEEVYIPNMEIQNEFQLAVEGTGWESVAQALKASDQLLQDTLNLDEAAVAKALDTVHMENTSILSYNNELSLSCVITLAYYSARKDYTLIRELPAGKGFADIVFLPHKNSNLPALIVELKWDLSAEGAISQIRNKRYVNALADYSGNLLLVGINYDRNTKAHRCKIVQAKK